ncbi:MAG: AAA family ATPase [Pyrinomonadaceae bacterium]
MRVAISGTHCSGKSTLVEAFLQQHPDYSHEPEPYTVLVEDFGEEFSSVPTAEEFFRQLEFNVDRLGQYKPGANVIFERCQADFLAYILALQDLGRENIDTAFYNAALDLAVAALPHLDLIVYLPANEVDRDDVPDEEDPELRDAVDRWLRDILIDDEFSLFSAGFPLVLEANGSTVQRLGMLESLVF